MIMRIMLWSFPINHILFSDISDSQVTTDNYKHCLGVRLARENSVVITCVSRMPNFEKPLENVFAKFYNISQNEVKIYISSGDSGKIINFWFKQTHGYHTITHTYLVRSWRSVIWGNGSRHSFMTPTKMINCILTKRLPTTNIMITLIPFSLYIPSNWGIENEFAICCKNFRAHVSYKAPFSIYWKYKFLFY